MKVILLSGGSGKRLWPLSNDQRSKQFIKILRNPENDLLESMVQRVWSQLSIVGLAEDTFIATGESQRSILKAQLEIDDSKIITEPSRRDTFPAIALASTYLYSEMNVSEDETVIVLPVDPYVDTEFFRRVMDLEKLLENKDTTLALLGVNPVIPSEKYGYIVPETTYSNRVEKFQEKPSRAVAKQLIDNGAIWNAGVFGFKLSTILDMLRMQSIPTKYSELSDQYTKLPRNSFDYEFTEKQSHISFIKYDGYWKDIGTWNTLTEEMDARSVGFTTELLDSSNTNVVNETNLPIAVIGVENLIIAAGPEGILVSTKEDSPRVKELSTGFFESVNFVEEDWGVRHTLTETDCACTTHYKVLNGKKLYLKLKSNEKIVRLSGEATISHVEDQVTVEGIRSFNFLVVMEEKY